MGACIIIKFVIFYMYIVKFFSYCNILQSSFSVIGIFTLPYLVPHLRGGSHIDFGEDPIGIGVGICIGIGVTLSCLHSIL